MYIIYGVSDCPYCLRAQALCMEKDIEYVWVNMDWSKTYREKMKELFKWKTYPIVVKLTDYTEELVGGFDELQLELLSNEQ
jgi:glutaredoxin